MKYKVLVFCLSVCGIIVFAQAKYKNHDFIAQQDVHKYLVNEQGHVDTALLQLLALTNIKHEGSLQSIVEQTQKSETGWLRKPGLERWDMVNTSVENSDQFFQLFDKLHLVNEISPQQKQYDYLLCMGATYASMKLRLQYAIDLWNKGIRYNEIVMLSGARPLTQAETAKLQSDCLYQEGDFIPETEAEAMKFLYEKMNMPDEMRRVSMVLINVPMKMMQNGTLARPTTGDTVDAWMELHPKPDACLVISNQPHIGYQDSVTKTLLPKSFTVETVGAKSNETNISVYLDALARTLYQEKKRQNL